MYKVSCVLTIQAVVFIFRIQTAEPFPHSTHPYTCSAQNESNAHLWLNDHFLVRYSLAYKKPLYKKTVQLEQKSSQNPQCCLILIVSN